MEQNNNNGGVATKTEKEKICEIAERIEQNAALISPEEGAMRASINKLMKEWKDSISKELDKLDKRQAQEYESKEIDKMFISDGFYPYYTKQKYRILFIAKFSPELGEYEDIDEDLCYIPIIYYSITERKKIGATPLDGHKFHSLMLKVAYGILNGFIPFASVGKASCLASKFAREGGFSYAFMNISKLKGMRCDCRKSILEISKEREFVAREIEILKPDIIIGMNLKEELKELFDGIFTKEPQKKYSGDNIWRYELRIGNEKYCYLDSHSFAAINKEEQVIYDSIMEACKEQLEGREKTNDTEVEQ